MASYNPDWTYSGANIQSFFDALNPTGAYTNEQVLAMPYPIDPTRTVSQYLMDTFGSVDPSTQLPDPMKGSLMPTGNDLAGMMLAIAPIAGMVGGAALGAGAGAEALGAGAAEAAWGANSLMPAAIPETASTLAGWGMTEIAPGFWSAAGSMMPAAVPELASNLSAMGLQEVSPGVWSQPAMAAASGASGGLMSRLASSLGMSEDSLSRLLGAAIPAGVGAYASSQQTDALKELADKYVNMGAPYRDRLASLYANPAGFLSSPEVQIPVQQGTDALARSLSAKVGNPIDNMTALQELQNYSANQLFGRLGQEKDRLAGFGGLSSYNQAAPGMERSVIGSDANFWNALGAGAANYFSPPQNNLENLLKAMSGMGDIFKVS